MIQRLWVQIPGESNLVCSSTFWVRFEQETCLFEWGITLTVWFYFHWSWCLFSSADDVSSAELMVLLIVRRPSVNFCFKSLLLLQFLFDNSEFFTGETRHIVPPCNKARIPTFCLEFQKLQKFQISWKRYSSYSSYSIILNFLLEKLGI